MAHPAPYTPRACCLQGKDTSKVAGLSCRSGRAVLAGDKNYNPVPITMILREHEDDKRGKAMLGTPWPTPWTPSLTTPQATLSACLSPSHTPLCSLLSFSADSMPLLGPPCHFHFCCSIDLQQKGKTDEKVKTQLRDGFGCSD